MKRRGTGWIPDYPDLSDYTLENADQQLSHQVQSQGSTASIETLAKKVCEALDVLAKQADESKGKALNELREGLEKEILGGVEFISVDFHDVLKEGDVDSEVLLIKHYLHLILQQPGVANNHIFVDYRPDVTDITLTKKILSMVQFLLEAQLEYSERCKKHSLEDTNNIDLDGIVCLRLLANSVSGNVDTYFNFQPAGLDTNLKIAEYWSNCFREKPELFQKLIEIQGNLQKSSDPFINTQTEIVKRITSTQTQLINRAQFITRLYDFWQDFNELKQVCDSLFQFFDQKREQDPHYTANVLNTFFSYNQSQTEAQDIEPQDSDYPAHAFFDQEQLDRDNYDANQRYIQDLQGCMQNLHRIKEILQKLSSELNAIQADKDNLNEIEIPLYDPYSVEDKKKQLEDLRSKFMNQVNPLNQLLIDLEDWRNQIQLKIETLISELDSPEITLKIQSKLIWNFTLKVCALPYPFTLEIGETLPEYLIQFIINEVSTERLSQIPPQFFERKEIAVETPIHSDLFKLAGKELVGEFRLCLENPLPQQAQFSKEVHDLIRSIVEVVAQMLMPLGQNDNLSDAIAKAWEKIRYWMSQEEDTQSERRQLIQEAPEQQGSPLPKDVAVDNSSLQKMALSALQEISKNLVPLDEGFKQVEDKNCCLLPNCSLVQLIDKIPNTTEEQSLLLKRKQALFRVRSKGEPSGGRKQIQFPISRKLRAENPEIQTKLSGETSTSGTPENKEQDRHKPDAVYLTLPGFVDLSYWFSPVEDQGGLNACTAHAGIALIEYAQSKSSGTYIDASPLFLYKVTRNLMQQEGDAGASMRDTMKAMVAFGVCPEDHWSYDEAQFDQEPPAFCYSFAENYKTLKYFRLDHGTISRSVLLAQVKVLLASEMPCAFGFTLYNSVYNESNFAKGHIPLPTHRDKVVGGHVVVAVGYHDRKIIKNSDGDQFEGALLIRNSWGSRWGQGGYGWMPYEYVTKGLTADWWSLLKAEWLTSGRFGAGASAWDSDQGKRRIGQ